MSVWFPFLLLVVALVNVSPFQSLTTQYPKRVPALEMSRISMEEETVTKTEKSVLDQRRGFLASAFVCLMSAPKLAHAIYVLDDETGEYIEVEESDWKTTWKQRLDKAKSMSTDEVFQAARGAGNTELRQGPESDASKKRRAMSACRDAKLRAKANFGNERECTARVFKGETDILQE